MSYKKQLEESIAHHLRMRKWGAKQSKTGRVLPRQNMDNDAWVSFPGFKRMRQELGEIPNEEQCALCIAYSENKCKHCLLAIVGNKCEIGGSLWRRIVDSKTWGQFVKAEDGMIFVLRILLGGISSVKRKNI